MRDDLTSDRLKDQSAPSAGASGAEVIGIVAAVLWLALVGGYFIVMPPEGGLRPDSLQFILILVAVFMPLAVIWVAVAASRSARIYREETARLQTSIEAMRNAFLAEREAKMKGMEPTVEKKLHEIAASTQKTESALATFASSRDTTKPALRKIEPFDDQPALALGTTAEDFQQPLASRDLIRALNFPDTEEDEEGFAALRLALRDRQARLLVQASQDILTLLSQDGIYMDDMRPDRSRPEIWRRFANGERGRTVAALGGIRDRSSLALTAGRMREDAIFRDTAHHFLRRFDMLLVAFEPTASDEELVALSETRTARAFMLLGRVTGAFD